MSVHDVGTGDNRKTNINPSGHDLLKQRRADGTEGITPIVDGFTGGYVSTKDGQIIVHDGTTIRILIGRAPSGEYGIWEVAAGQDVRWLFPIYQVTRPMRLTGGTQVVTTT